LPDLVGAEEGQVVTRFPPEPNGHMHIGHAKAAIIGFEYAKRYQGRFLLRFDDTNPAAEKKEYYAAFLESLEWLGITPSKIKNASDDIQEFYELAEQMIKNSKAYVCACPQDAMRKNRGSGLACVHRSQTLEQNLSLWRDMISGKTEKNSAVLRFMGDMNSLNTTMRDPVLFRVVEEPHPLKGNKYRIWPTYDFDGAVEDSLDGVTHAMRSKEYELRDETYFAILEALGLRRPTIVEFSRLDLQNTTVSKRNLRKLIEQGSVSGWDDPRLPTISGLRRRGILPEAIREFILSMGVSKVESQPTWDLLESFNRKVLDPIAKRYFFVEDPVLLKIEGAPKTQVSLRFHPDKEMGERKIETDGRFLISSDDAKFLSEGAKIRLIEAFNVEITSIAEGIKARYLGVETEEKMRKIQWVVPDQSVPLKVKVTGPLLINDEYNPASMRDADGSIESSAKQMKVGEIFQLVRFGFCRLDSPGIAIMTHK
ncbi:MAG: glutamate--tRNA ligase, partial [Nitrososphaerales archaeon]